MKDNDRQVSGKDYKISIFQSGLLPMLSYGRSNVISTIATLSSYKHFI